MASRPTGSVPVPATSWPAPYATGPVRGTVLVPGSKSLTNRYLLLAALAAGPGRIRQALRSRDTRLMARALEAMGAVVREEPGTGPVPDLVVVPPTDGVFHAARVDCGLAGTVMRFVPLLAALADGPVEFDGDAQARHRPVGATLEALRALGCGVEDGGRGTLPFTVHPALAGGRPTAAGGEIAIDCSASSQFLSAVLLVGARFAHGVTVRNTGGPVPSLPHVDMTRRVLEAASVGVRHGDGVWRVEPGPVAARDVTVEPDLTNAGAFLAAAMATAGRVTVPHWPADSLQAGPRIVAVLEALGGRAELTADGLTLTGPERMAGADLDLHDVGEFAPTVAVLAATADGPTRLRGIGHLRGHETDRLAALHRELTALGGDVEETADGLVVRPRPLHGGVFGTHADHRMAMAGAILGLRVPGVVVEDIGATTKTLPEFAALWTGLVTPAVAPAPGRP